MAITTDGVRQQDVELKQEIDDLKQAQAGLTATQAGGMATMAASQAGLAGSVISGFTGFVVGLFLGLAIKAATEPRGRRYR